MSQVVAPPPLAPAPEQRPNPPLRTRFPKLGKRLLIGISALIALTACVFFGWRANRGLSQSKDIAVPTAKVERGNLALTITARGELRGRNPEVLVAPMMGGAEMHITFLRRTGEAVKPGDVVVQFDTTEQEYKLKEAQADLAEAEQHLLQAKAQREAEQEEDRYALLKAKADLSLAELDVRKNPLVPAILAKQNDLALSQARDHLAQLEQNLTNRQATGAAAIAMQEAGRTKAEAQATTARQNIEAMTLRASRAGYVSVKQNSTGGFFFYGMTLPLFQVGDTVRPGMAVAEIPDLNNWEIGATIAELDRGHLAPGNPVAITVIAAPHQKFTGHVRDIGGTNGPPWDRRFECHITLDNPSPELRPGMSSLLVIITGELHDALWLPAQALFESDGRTFVYVQSGKNFAAKDVKLVQRSETRAAVSGLASGQVVALANPLEAAKKKPTSASPLETLPK
ncbi:MAG: efflux RND transporter periplasmic adaptor subunit [Acidobacteriaceae bacterium]|nr:efflux RND transporter periplasmic adaptor subunit [Acidobacteriaceae bacterium]